MAVTAMIVEVFGKANEAHNHKGHGETEK